MIEMYSWRMHLEVRRSANCPDEVNCIFSEAGPSRRLYAVPVDREGRDVWAQVVGWDAEAGAPVPAWTTLVNDSADGHAVLVHGGTGGIRLQPLEASDPWSADAAVQWGEPFLLLRTGVRLVLWDEAHPIPLDETGQ